MNKIDFRTSGYFPFAFMFLAGMMMVVGLVVISKSVLAGGLILMVGITILTAHNRLAIDLHSKTYRQYLWILGMKHGDIGKFEQIQYLFINRKKVNQTMNHLAGSTTIRKDVYDAFLKFSDHDKIHLATSTSRTAMVKKLNTVAARLNVKVVDYSDGEFRAV